MNNRFEHSYRVLLQMLVAEVLQCKLLRCNFVHRGAGVSNRTNFVGVELLPPVQRGGDVKIDRNHPHEFAMVSACVAEGSHEVEVVRAENIFCTNLDIVSVAISVYTICAMSWTMRGANTTITLRPRVLRVPHTTNGVFPANNLGVFNFQHFLPP